MTKKLKFSLIIAFTLLLTLFAGVLAGCGGKNDDNAQIVVKSDMIKTEYVVGEELEITGGILEYISNEKITHIQITKDMISNFSTEKLGSYSMIVTYNGKTTTVSYTVNKGFSLSKLYYAENITPECWIKFNEQESKVYLAQGTSTLPATVEEWERFGIITSYTKFYKNGKLFVSLVYNDPYQSVTCEIETISSSKINLITDGQTDELTAVN